MQERLSRSTEAVSSTVVGTALPSILVALPGVAAMPPKRTFDKDLFMPRHC